MFKLNAVAVLVVCLFSGAHAASFLGDVIALVADKFSSLIDPFTSSSYGVDYTWQIHGNLDLESPMAANYKKVFDGCVRTYSFELCEKFDIARVASCLHQPKNTYNFTKLGFEKVKVPDKAWKLISDFYNENKNNRVIEKWSRGSAYVNYWDAPAYILEDKDGMIMSNRSGWIRDALHEALRPAVEEWLGVAVYPTSMHGIRIYTRGAVLTSHVDKNLLFASLIINVDQDVDEPWPLEVYDHQGRAHNITLLPGEMIFYESRSIIHGRPFPFNGSFYANLFVNYMPTDYEKVFANARKNAAAGKKAPRGERKEGVERNNVDL